MAANKKVWLAAGLNLFFMGAGTLYLGHRKALGLALTLSALTPYPTSSSR